MNSNWDLPLFEHDQRDVTDGMRTVGKLPVNVASKNYVCFLSTCPEGPVKSCFFDPILLEVIKVCQPCACTWCCNTKSSASSVLLTVFSVLCLVLFVTAVHIIEVDTSPSPHGSNPINRSPSFRVDEGSSDVGVHSFDSAQFSQLAVPKWKHFMVAEHLLQRTRFLRCHVCRTNPSASGDR